VTGKAKKRCPQCGFRWLTATLRQKSLTSRSRKEMPMLCPSCSQTVKVPIQWMFERIGGVYDPSFGLPLWLKASCCGETLWAYSSKHLDALREYVSAGLRERTGVRHWSMFARLPKWIASRNNRDAVLECIERLQRTLPKRETN
jgi:hypothetical protein